MRSYWISLQSYWLTRDRDHLIFASLLFVIIFSLVFWTVYAVNKSKEQQQLFCLSKNIYHEARGEPVEGQYAVARVTLNRVQSSRYPDTICEVVYEKRWDRIRKRYVGAFSWTELDEPPAIKSKNWRLAHEVAQQVYFEQVDTNHLKDALFYHANYIKPSWAKQKYQLARIGQHIFYK